jgi:hypothetical protein
MDGIDIADTTLSIVGKVALTAGETALFAEVPFLNFPVVKQIVEYILGRFETAVMIQLQKSTNAVLIFENEEGKADVANQAAATLKSTQTNPTATAAEKEKAIDDFRNAYAGLIGFRISSDSVNG